MKAIEELQRLGIERCPECNCAVGDDWKYKDFSNKTIVVCPQCGEEINLPDYPQTQDTVKITSWDNPLMQYCVERLKKVPKFNFRAEIQFPDEEGGKPDYVSRLVRVLFSAPDKSGDVEMLDKAVKYIRRLSKEARIEFVANMRMYANSGRGQ